MEPTTQALGEIAGKTDNDIILLAIVLIIGIPLIVLYIKAKSDEKHMRHKEVMERDAESREREKTLMNVISGNTAAMVKLTTLLESNNQNCAECRADQAALNRDILEKAEAIHIDVIKVKERL